MQNVKLVTLFTFCIFNFELIRGEYRARTGDLLHAMQAL